MQVCILVWIVTPDVQNHSLWIVKKQEKANNSPSYCCAAIKKIMNAKGSKTSDTGKLLIQNLFEKTKLQKFFLKLLHCAGDLSNSCYSDS